MEPIDSSPNLITRRSFIRQAACAALGTAAVTNALRDLRFMNVALAQQSGLTDYKALVCVFLQGGNDSNNWIIPTEPTEYANYRAIRGAPLALPNTDGSGATALAMNALNGGGQTYGFHPSCADLQTLFNNGQCAAVFNVGTLVYPMTKAQYSSNSVARPPQLFSHGDQVAQWQTSIPDRIPTTGWGGRCADILDVYNPKNSSGQSLLSLAISVAGSNTWEVGGIAQQYAVSPTSGVISLTSNLGPTATQGALGPRQVMMNNLLGYDAAHMNLIKQNYALALQKSIAAGTALSTAMNNGPLNTSNPTYWSTLPSNVVVPNGGPTNSSSLMSQLKMVARMIDAGYRSTAQGGLGMKRQIFFCMVGGYDTHNGQTNNSGSTTYNNTNVIRGAHSNLLAEVSQSIKVFQDAMGKIGQQYGDANFLNRVTTFTASDFSRNFPTNGSGCDHGWGGHHVVVGGAVNGQRTYGKFPVLAVGGPDDTSSGRWIPTTSVDQFAATMAKWFGVSPSQMSQVFPNLSRFDNADLGFMKQG
jgi:uncharacterized protein (DUF1501 family)